MKCPNCHDAALVMADRQGVEIDYCPLCRGVWLDRGELDKLIERSINQEPVRNAAPVAETRTQRPDFVDSDYRQGHNRDSRYRDSRSYNHNRKKSWLSDIFD